MKTRPNQQSKQAKVPSTPTPYDTLSITDLERKVVELSALSRESMREMYTLLEYLRTSSRYKENPSYKKATFWQYIEDIFTIREGTYRENSRAFTKFPEYAVEYGVGIVAKVDRLCGGAKVSKVMDEIKRENLSHKKPLSRSSVENIIQKYRATPRISKTITDWKAMYEAESARHETTKTNLKIALAEIKELHDQVSKLKSAAQKFNDMRDVFVGYEKVVSGVELRA